MPTIQLQTDDGGARLRAARGRRCGPVAVLAAVLCVSAGHALADGRADYLRRFDTNGDGRISLDEYLAYMSRGFHAMDRNGDGVLDAGELPPGNRHRAPVTLDSHRRALTRMFDRLDTNNDGYLDRNELTAAPW